MGSPDTTDFTHVACVHHETTAGVLNPVGEIGAAVKEGKKPFFQKAAASLLSPAAPFFFLLFLLLPPFFFFATSSTFSSSMNGMYFLPSSSVLSIADDAMAARRARAMSSL